MSGPSHPNGRGGTFHPPWVDHGIEYGPTTESGYERAAERFDFSLEGKGFWDFEQEDRMVGMRNADPKPAKTVAARYDTSRLQGFVDAHSGQIPKGELAVYVLLLKGASIRNVARTLQVRRETVRSYLKRLERRVGRFAAAR